MTSPTAPIACYYINLDRAPVRRRYMDDLARQIGIRIERVAAVDGAMLDDAFCRTVNPRIPAHKPLTKSEVGCFLSHRAAWERVAANGQPWGCVLEDDICLSDDIARYLGTSTWIPPKVRLIRLETFPAKRVMLGQERTTIPGDRALAETKSFSLGAAGYLLTAELAQELLAATKVFHKPFDILLNSSTFNPIPDLRIWQIIPAVCIQQKNLHTASFLPEDAEASSITYSLVKRPMQRRGWRKMVHRRINNVKTKLINWRAVRRARQIDARWQTVPFRK